MTIGPLDFYLSCLEKIVVVINFLATLHNRKFMSRSCRKKIIHDNFK